MRFIEACLKPEVRGLRMCKYGPIPLSKVLNIIDKPTLPVPAPLFKAYLDRAWRYRLTSFPAGELDHIRFNSVLDTSRASELLDVEANRSLYGSLSLFRALNHIASKLKKPSVLGRFLLRLSCGAKVRWFPLFMGGSNGHGRSNRLGSVFENFVLDAL